ncbi:MAG: LysE family transporter [Bacteroidetes bacterium]|nr:LysE family transporter [Bacteroidota bacterium]
MMLSLLSGFVVGYILAVPPGPVGVTILKSGMRGDEKCGVSIAAGAGAMDVLFCAFAIFATSALFLTFDGIFADYPFALLIFQAIVVAAMVIYGVLQFRIPKTSVEAASNKQPLLGNFIQRLKRNGPFFLGVGIALANIANPTFLPSLCYTAVGVQHFGFVGPMPIDSVLFSLGFGVGNFCWSYTLLRTIIHFRSRFSPSFTLRLHQFAGLTMIGVGTYLGYRVLLVTKWAELIRWVFAF